MASTPLRAVLRYQLHHRWQAALALSGIIMGVAVVAAVDIANSAARASFALSAEQLRGAATHRITSPGGWLPAALYTRLFTTPGAPPMAPVISTRIRVDGHDQRFQLIGLDLFAERPFRSELREAVNRTDGLADWLTRPGMASVSERAAGHLGVAPGERLDIRHEGRPYELELFAVYAGTAAASRNLIVVDIATAQAVTGQADSISYIDLILTDDQVRVIENELPASVRLLSIDEQTAGVVGLSASFELNLTAMSLLALLVGVFLIFNAASFSVVQRRKLFGRLRALGVHGNEILYLVLAEALVLALIGTLIGALLGVWLGQALTGIVAATVSSLYYDAATGAFTVSAASMLKAAVLGIGGTLVAFWLPAQQAARTPPLTTLSRASLERATHRHLPRLAVLGAALIIVGLIVALWLPGGTVTGFAGLFLLLVGAALVSPSALTLAHRALSRLPLSGVPRMAVRDLDRHLSRLATAAAALMVALAASIGVAVMVDSMRASVSDWLRDLLNADLYIANAAFEEGATLPAGTVRTATRLPQASDHSLYRDRSVTIDGIPVRIVAARLAQRSRAGFKFTATLDTPWQRFDTGSVIVSEPLAYRLDLTPGDHLRLPGPQGDRAYPVAAVFRDYASEHGRLFIAREHYLRQWRDPAIETVALFAQGPPATLWDSAQTRLADAEPLVFTLAQEIYDESMAIFDKTFRITEVLRWLSLLVAFIGILSALMAVQLERRREYAVMRALGLTRRQISGLILLESGIVGLLAGLLAVPTGIAMAWILTDAIQLRAFGWTMPFLVDPKPLLISSGLGLLAALLAGLYPAWHASWHDPAPQLRED